MARAYVVDVDRVPLHLSRELERLVEVGEHVSPRLRASKSRSSSGSKYRPDLKAANAVSGKLLLYPFAGLLYPPVQGFIANVFAISQIKATTVVIPEERPSLSALELPPLLHHVVGLELQIRLRIDDNE